MELAWFDRMLANPPSCLSQLERLVGELDVDFAGHEGMGSVMRPHPIAPRGALHVGVTRVDARFSFDIHHQDPRRPRDMTLDSVAIGVDTVEAELRRSLAARFGGGRAVMRDHDAMLEYGAWFYLSVGVDRPARVAWHRRVPEWALPRVAPTTRDDFLATLVDRLVCDATESAIVDALAPLVATVGGEITSPMRVRSGGARDGILLVFRPGLALAAVVEAFRWERPVAQSSDVHMTTWRVMPLAAADTPPWRPRLGRWVIDANLERLPRGEDGAELPRLGRAGPSPRYDLYGCNTTVTSISIVPDEDATLR